MSPPPSKMKFEFGLYKEFRTICQRIEKKFNFAQGTLTVHLDEKETIPCLYVAHAKRKPPEWDMGQFDPLLTLNYEEEAKGKPYAVGDGAKIKWIGNLTRKEALDLINQKLEEYILLCVNAPLTETTLRRKRKK